MTKRHYYPSEVQFPIENSFAGCSLFLMRHSELINTFQDHSRNKSVRMYTEIEKKKKKTTCLDLKHIEKKAEEMPVGHSVPV